MLAVDSVVNMGAVAESECDVSCVVICGRIVEDTTVGRLDCSCENMACSSFACLRSLLTR